MSQAKKLWEVEIDQQIYQADEDTIKYWVIEGRVKPYDKIRGQGENWTEVGKLLKLQSSNPTSKPSLTDPKKAPSLVELENAQIPTIMANQATAKDILKEIAKKEITEKQNEQVEDINRKETILEPIFYRRENWDKYLNAKCQYHPELVPEVLCPECGATFCKHCAQASVVGGAFNKASECVICGSLCRYYSDIKEKLLALTEQKAEFGWNDFIFALKFPLGLDLAPILIFTILSAVTAFAFPAFITVSLLSNAVICAVKDAAIGEKQARQLDYVSFFSGFGQPLTVGLAAILIIMAPLFASIVGTLKVVSILSLIGLAWAVFYYPIAILVGGLTESVAQVVNLKVGFEAVKKMGESYKKFFGYFFILELPMIVLYFMLPELPMIEKEGVKVPNIIAIVMIIGFIGLTCGAIFFYLNVVMGALVGRLVFKSADKLGMLTKATTRL
jgi:hypothetical protein